jgi:hypothetical protein
MKSKKKKANKPVYVKCICTRCRKKSNQRRALLNVGVRCYTCGGNIVAERFAS